MTQEGEVFLHSFFLFFFLILIACNILYLPAGGVFDAQQEGQYSVGQKLERLLGYEAAIEKLWLKQLLCSLFLVEEKEVFSDHPSSVYWSSRYRLMGEFASFFLLEACFLYFIHWELEGCYPAGITGFAQQDAKCIKSLPVIM